MMTKRYREFRAEKRAHSELLNLLSQSCKFGVTGKRDGIFGLMHIATDYKHGEIQVDYTKPFIDVSIDALDFHMRQHRNLDFLLYTNIAPTWLPDWSDRKYDATHFSVSEHHKASLDIPSPEHATSANRRHLILYDFKFDTVISVKDDIHKLTQVSVKDFWWHLSAHFTDMVCFLNIRLGSWERIRLKSAEDALLTFVVMASIAEYRDQIIFHKEEEVQLQGLDEGKQLRTSDEIMPKNDWGDILDNKGDLNSESDRCLSLESDKDLSPESDDGLSLESDGVITLEEIGLDEYETGEEQEFWDKNIMPLFYHLGQDPIIQTHNGQVGFVPQCCVKESDEVWLLFGCCMPVILREVGAIYLYISPAQINGVMKGGLVKDFSVPVDNGQTCGQYLIEKVQLS
jgi:hypothetical protein